MTSTPLISDSACNLVVKKKLWDGLIYIYILGWVFLYGKNFFL